MTKPEFKRQDFFDYVLPRERIAQRPVRPYDQAKLLVLDRHSGQIKDSKFTSISDFLNSGDLIIFNNTKVIKARLFAKINNTIEAEIFLLRAFNQSASQWIVTGKPLKKVQIGAELDFGKIKAKVVERVAQREILIDFSSEDPEPIKELLNQIGHVPIPPYIRDGLDDPQDFIDYQTSFAKVEGSVAAPTASLHFTPELLQKIQNHNVQIDFVTMHLGPPSFLPLFDDPQANIAPPGIEYFFHDHAILDKINKTRANRKRVIAVGTSVVRALESMSRLEASSELQPTELFIYPGFKFNQVDIMVTNFHQPGTSHLLLVQAFLGKTLLEKTYQHALLNDYRFLSYGDGMVVL